MAKKIFFLLLLINACSAWSMRHKALIDKLPSDYNTSTMPLKKIKKRLSQCFPKCFPNRAKTAFGEKSQKIFDRKHALAIDIFKSSLLTDIFKSSLLTELELRKIDLLRSCFPTQEQVTSFFSTPAFSPCRPMSYYEQVGFFLSIATGDFDLLTSCINGHKNLPASYIEKGFVRNVKLRSNYPLGKGCTPLIVAAINDRRDIVSLLLDEGALVNQTSTPFRLSALQAASYRLSSDAIMSMLLKRGARVNYAGDALQRSALVDLIKKKKVILNKMGKTAEDVTGAVKLLLDYNADIYQEDVGGDSAYSLVTKNVEDIVDPGITKLILDRHDFLTQNSCSTGQGR